MPQTTRGQSDYSLSLEAITCLDLNQLMTMFTIEPRMACLYVEQIVNQPHCDTCLFDSPF